MRIKYLIFIVIFFLSINYAIGEVEMFKEKGVYAVMETSKGTITIKLFDDKTPVTVNNFVGLAEGTKEWTDPQTKQKVKKPFYNGLIFHRVIKDFMIQGGCPIGNGTGNPGYSFEDECFEAGEQIKGEIKDEQTAFLVWEQLIVPHLKKYGMEGPNKTINEVAKGVMTKNNGTPLIGKTVELFQKETNNNKPVRKRGKLLYSVDYGTICMANSGPNTNGSQFFIVTKKDGCSWLNGKHTVFGKIISGMETAHTIENVKTGQNDKPVEDVIIKNIIVYRVK